jgi:hypothetical protein
MKHILNDMSEQEKNSIREQHSGGMKVMTENFSKLINSKLGDSKPLVSEQAQAAPAQAAPAQATPSQNNPFLKCFTDQGIPENMVPESCKTPDFSVIENIRPGLCSSEMMKSELFKKPEWQDKIDLATANHLKLMFNKLNELTKK